MIDSKIEKRIFPEFGDYCSIEQHRFDGENEFYGYKILCSKRSNSWVEVPVKGSAKPELHDHLEYVVSCVLNGPGDEMPMNYRIDDLHRIIPGERRSKALLDEVIELAQDQVLNGEKGDDFDKGWRSAFRSILRHIEDANTKKEAKP